MSDIASGYYSLGMDLNKVHRPDDNETEEGAIGQPEDELKLDTSDDELIALKTQWEKNWTDYDKEISQQQKDNENYWKGMQHPGQNLSPKERPLIDNLIFESLETYLPLATKNNPEPVVDGDGTDAGSQIAKTVQKFLVHLASTLRMKLKIKRVARYWALYLLGVVKVGWSLSENEITMAVPRPQKLILDPDSTINDDMEYEGGYIGEYRKETARDLLNRFGKTNQVGENNMTPTADEANKENLDEVGRAIHAECDGKLGTEIQYQEWWTPKMVFWTLKKQVLGKYKNPHWNYQGTPQTITDPTGAQQTIMSAPRNHFKQPKMPYVFLSVFNLGKRPHDDTTLISQNLAAQDVINKRQRQIDKNVDWMNGGWAISGEKSGLARDEAANAIEAARKGGGIWIPQGTIGEAIGPITRPGLPADVFNHLQDIRNEVRNSFGTRGSTPQGTQSEQTVRGKIITKGQDGDRIGGGVSEYLEIFSEQVFNWFIQLILVYYDEPHEASVVGDTDTKELVQLQSSQIQTDLTVTVKTGSLIPKDSLTKANQAVELAGQGLIDPLTMFDRLEFPNPRESSERLLLFKANLPGYVQKYFPDLAQLFQPQQPPEKLPSESIGFSDLPPEGQVQMAAKVGIQLTPEQVAVHQVAQEVIKHAGRSAVAPAAEAQLQSARPGFQKNPAAEQKNKSK